MVTSDGFWFRAFAYVGLALNNEGALVFGGWVQTKARHMGCDGSPMGQKEVNSMSSKRWGYSAHINGRLSVRTMVSAVVTALVASGLALAGVTSPAQAAGTPMAVLPTDNPANWTPNILDGEVQSIYQVGNKVIVGGSFTQVQDTDANGGALFTRRYIVAFDATTGKVDTSFAPVLDGVVNVILPTADGTGVYIGGDFNTVNGTNRRKVARLLVSNGSLVTSFNMGGANGLVRDLRLVGSELYVAGHFTTLGGQTRRFLGSLNPTTGKVDTKLNLNLTGLKNGGIGKVIKFDTDTAGTKLIFIGNFTAVNGLSRVQAAMADLTTTPATLSNWSTTFYTSVCSNSFDSYLRDVDMAEDGSYAIAVTTGSYGGINSSCDTIARFETSTAAAVSPTWTNVTGGDTSYSAQIHNGVVFIGGHMRWVNNPFVGDRHGAGGVSRPGMSALDPETGLPFSWNPTRTRGVGLFDWHITPQGVWAGSDTDRWNQELHGRIAFFPWNGGVNVAPWDIGHLPNDVISLGNRTGTTGTDSSVLYRINAGGPAVLSADDGPAWAADTAAASPYRNASSGYYICCNSEVVSETNATVPDSDFDRVPAAIFTSERWDPRDATEMQWYFPVAAGTPIQVRLYFSERAFTDAGARVFDVDIDGVNMLNDHDPVVAGGYEVGYMQSFNLVSDGTVNLLFRHGVVDNPFIRGIEIVRTDQNGIGSLGTQDAVVKRSYSGTGAPGAATTLQGTVPWRHVRAAFMVNGTLYTGMEDSGWVRRSYDGTTFGPGQHIDMWGNTVTVQTPTMTGAFYDPALRRVYYTVANSAVLYWRTFNPESGVFNAQSNTTGGAVAALSPARVLGMFLSENTLYFVDANSGALYKMNWVNGAPSGTPTLADNTVDWRGRTTFMLDGAQPNVAPDAAFTQTCAVNICDFDGSASTDSDGSINNYSWDFGDGTVATGSTPQHIFQSGGTYTVSLTVTDDRVGTDTITHEVTVEDPPNVGPTAVVSGSCVELDCQLDGGASSDPDGNIVDYAWDFGDGETGTGPAPSHTYAAQGTYTVTLVVTDNDGATATATTEVEALSPNNVAKFRAANQANSSTANASVAIPTEAVAGDQLILVVTANVNTTISTPSGWTLLGTQQDGTPDLTSSVFTKTASITDPGSTVAATLGTSAKVSRIVTAYSGAAPVTVAQSSVMGSTTTSLATPSAPVAYAGSAAVNYWSDKSAGNTGWVLPGSITSRSVSLGSGTGQVTAALGDAQAGAGTWPGATADSSVAGTKGIGWSVIVPPASGNFSPAATFTPTCALMTCSFDASGSVDPDGTIESYDWDFGDGTSGTGAAVAHTYTSQGTKTVTLTITDNRGASSTATATVAPTESDIDFRASASANSSTTAANLTVPASVQAGDQLVYFVTASVATTLTTPAGWTLLGTADDGTPDVRSWVFTKTASGTDAGSTVSATLGTSAKVSRTLLAYAGASAVNTVSGAAAPGNATGFTSPAISVPVNGSMLLSYWSSKDSANDGWVLPVTVIGRDSSVGSGTGHVTTAAAEAGANIGVAPGQTATVTTAFSKGVAWTVLLTP